MNIAIFTNNYLPNPYGVANSIESFRKEFEKRGPASTRGDSSTQGGHRVFIFAPRWKGYEDKNPQVFRYPALDIEFKIKFPLAIPYSLKINKILSKLNLDIIHSQHPNLLGAAAARWARKKKIPLIFTWHTLYHKYAHFAGIVPEKIAAGYIIRKAVKYANKAGAVIAPTDSIIPILRKWGVTNKNIIPVATGVDEEYFINADRNIIRKKYNIAEDEILLLLVSRLTSEKNIEFVFRSVAGILKNNKKTKFLVSGGGYLVPPLREFCKGENIADKVFFSGVAERKDIKNCYAAGDIFVYASKSETQGMVITEAMYMGLPIVAVDATGVKSLVLNNANGFLVKDCEKEFSEAVLKLVKNKDLRDKFGEVSRRIAKTQFTSGICASKMLEVYKKAIINHSR